MPRLSLLLPLFLVLAGCGTDTATPAANLTTADEVSDAMLAAFESNVGTVDGFTIKAEGAEGRYTVLSDTASMDRVTLDVVPDGGTVRPGPGVQLLYNHVPNITRIAGGMRGATFEGRSVRDGRPAYVLSTNTPEAMLGSGGGAAMDGDRILRLYVDPETFDVLEIYQSFEADTTAFTTRLIYSDFRTEDGLRLPYSVRQITTGLNQAIPENQRIAMGGQIGLSMRQAEQMPQGPERTMQIEQLESELKAVMEGIQEVDLTVESVEIGLPEPAPSAPPAGAPGAPPVAPAP